VPYCTYCNNDLSPGLEIDSKKIETNRYSIKVKKRITPSIADYFVTIPMVTGGDEETILVLVIEPSPPFSNPIQSYIKGY